MKLGYNLLFSVDLLKHTDSELWLDRTLTLVIYAKTSTWFAQGQHKSQEGTSPSHLLESELCLLNHR